MGDFVLPPPERLRRARLTRKESTCTGASREVDDTLPVLQGPPRPNWQFIIAAIRSSTIVLYSAEAGTDGQKVPTAALGFPLPIIAQPPSGTCTKTRPAAQRYFVQSPVGKKDGLSVV